MTKEQLTQEWIDSLNDCKYEIVANLDQRNDFLVQGDAIKNSDKKSLLLFNIDNADDRLVNALKSIVEKHDDKYFVGLITSDKTRNLKGTTTFGLVKPSIIWD